MKIRKIIISIVICALTVGIYIISNKYDINDYRLNKMYNVYLDDQVIGKINSKDDLYKLIDEKQKTIKEMYKVDNVYPPNALKVIETYSFNDKVDDLETIYNKISELEDFTIYGYEIKISQTEKHEEYSIYVLDKEVFNESLNKFILAFVDVEKYNDYMQKVNTELDDVGIVYDDMKIDENIVIREKYISANSKIYTSSEDLTRDLLFGFNHEEQSYTVKEGDTIESVSDEHKLNTQEFLIANPTFYDKDNLLAIGDSVNVTLIDPELTLTYKVYEIKEEEQDYEKEVKRDNTKDSKYSEITQAGVKGLTRLYTNYTVTNGEESNDINIIESKVIRKPVNEIITKGKKASSGGGGAWGRETYVDTGSGWRWPTSSPFSVTSEFKWRWGKLHTGIDISGAGFGSNIFASNDGVVTYVNTSCPNNGGGYGDRCGSGYGNYVVISHGNNIYTLYAHMTKDIPVSVGQSVSRGQVIGHMGNSGSSTGYHLHFSLAIGEPNHGGVFRNPRELFR